MSKPVPVKTAETVFEVVDTLVSMGGATLAELGEQLEMPESTLHDHLRSLEAMGMVVKDDGTYRAGTRFLEIGERIRHQHELYRAGHDEVERLADTTGEHAGLMIEENGKGVLLFVAKGENAVELRAWGGRRFALPTNAAGKAILASLPDDRASEILDQHGLPAYTSKTITDRDELQADLQECSERGYATDTGELVEGVRAIAAPVVSRGTVLGSVAIGGPGNRMRGDRFREELPQELLRASNVVELDVSYG